MKSTFAGTHFGFGLSHHKSSPCLSQKPAHIFVGEDKSFNEVGILSAITANFTSLNYWTAYEHQ